MANWRFTIAYDGTAYAGWQIQPDSQTVQGCLHDCLSRLFQTEMTVAGCSRTDSGVHALCQVATFHPPPESPISATDAHRALRQMLPPDIRLLDTEIMPDGFHARHDAVGKCYTYVLHRGELQETGEIHRETLAMAQFSSGTTQNPKPHKTAGNLVKPPINI